MSTRAMAWAMANVRTKSGSAKAVLMVLADRADENNTCFPGIDTIASDADLSSRTVKRCIAYLEEIGAISRVRRYTGYQKRTSDRYKLHLEKVIDMGAPSETSEDEPLATTTSSSLGDNLAPNEYKAPAKPRDSPLGDKLAPNEKPVDNSPSLGAILSPSGDKLAPALTEEPPELTPRSSSVVNATNEAREAETTDDDDVLPPASDDSRVDFRRAVIERLVGSGVDPSNLDLNLAQRDVRDSARRSGRHVSDPVAYVTQAVLNEPHRWTRDDRSASRAGSEDTLDGPVTSIRWGQDFYVHSHKWLANGTCVLCPAMRESAAVCEDNGHEWTGTWAEQCDLCGAERPGWREDAIAEMSHRSVPSPVLDILDSAAGHVLARSNDHRIGAF